MQTQFSFYNNALKKEMMLEALILLSLKMVKNLLLDRIGLEFN